MARLKTIKSIDDKILECEEKLRKLKERCDRLTDELDGLYAEKKELEAKELLVLTSHYFPTQTLKTLINTELFVILLVDK